MRSSSLLLLIGAMAGSGLTLLYVHAVERDAPSGAIASDPDDARTRVADSLVPVTDSAAGFASERLAVYERAAQTTDPVELESMLADLVPTPRSRTRDVQIEALLARLAELDPERAALAGESLTLEARLVASVYRSWAQVDPDAALGALKEIVPSVRQQEFALAVLEGLGQDADGVARVADALPVAARFGFEFEALLARAETEPAAALAAALAGDPRTRQLLLPELAALFAAGDPFAALAQGSQIPDSLQRESYTRAVYEAWATTAPATLFDYLESSQAVEILGDYSIVNAIAGAMPERMLDLATALPEGSRYDVRFAALGALARRDAGAALAELQSLGLGSQFGALAGAIAREYGRQNPSAAVAWAWSLSPPSQTVRDEVLQGVAAVDYPRAVDLLLAELDESPGGRGFVGSSLMSFVTARGSDPGYLLERLLEQDSDRSVSDRNASNMADGVMSLWSRTNPEAAMAWAISNSDEIDAAVLSGMVQDMARRDPAAARLALAQLPPEQREAWIAGIASGLSRSDPAGAIAFLEPFRGQPGYASGLGEVVTAIARNDPARAGQLLADSDVAVPFEAAVLLAGSWSLLDFDGATRWLGSLRNERTRSSAIAGILMAQSERDPEAGRRWLLAMPAGSERDSGLNVLLAMSATRGPLDTRLLDAFSTDSARQDGVSRAVLMLARGNPDEARRLLQTQVTDPQLRLAIEEILARPGGPAMSPQAILAGEPIR